MSEQIQSTLTGRRSWWWLVAALAIGLIIGFGGLELLRMLARPLAMLIMAISIATALAPLVEWLDKYLPHPASVILVYTTVLLILFGIIGLTIPVVIAQTRGLIGQVQVIRPQIEQWLAQLGFDPTTLINPVLSGAGQLGSAVLLVPVNIVNALLDILLIIFLSLYWLFSTPGMKQFALSFFPAERRGFVNTVMVQVGHGMGGYLRGVAINGIIIGVLEYIGLLIIGVPYALVLGLLTGLMEFFPIIGAVIAGVITTLVALSVSPTTALITAIFAVVLQQTEGQILVPLVMRSQAQIQPLLAILAVISGAAVGGLLGAVVAIPLVAAISVLIRLVIAPALRRANGVGAEEV